MHILNNLSDEELIFRFVHHKEQAALGILFERYAHLVLGVCNKYLHNIDEAKDAMQQIFIKLIDDLPRFDIAQFKPWLYRVSQNHCLMLLRKKSPILHSDKELPEIMDLDLELHHSSIEREKTYEKLENAIENLSSEQRICIQMFYFKKKTYAEISRECGFSLMQVKSNIQNGKRNLKLKLEPEGGKVS